MKQNTYQQTSADKQMDRVTLGKRDRVLADRPLNANPDDSQMASATDIRNPSQAQKRRKLSDSAPNHHEDITAELKPQNRGAKTATEPTKDPNNKRAALSTTRELILRMLALLAEEFNCNH